MPTSDDAARRPLISANWKMNLNHFEAIQTVQKLSYLIGKDDLAAVDVSIHPPFTDIRSIQTLIEADELMYALGAQNCHWDDKGAFTGEVSPVFLNKLGVRYVIAGHSERRELFGETDDIVAQKIAAIERHHMTPILCVGETLAEREAGETESKVVGQLRAALTGRPPAEIGGMVIAYEPIWAIGTGRTATSEDAQAMCHVIRGVIGNLSDASTAAAVRIQYGGCLQGGNIPPPDGQPRHHGGVGGGGGPGPRGV